MPCRGGGREVGRDTPAASRTPVCISVVTERVVRLENSSHPGSLGGHTIRSCTRRTYVHACVWFALVRNFLSVCSDRATPTRIEHGWFCCAHSYVSIREYATNVTVAGQKVTERWSNRAEQQEESPEQKASKPGHGRPTALVPGRLSHVTQLSAHFTQLSAPIHSRDATHPTTKFQIEPAPPHEFQRVVRDCNCQKVNSTA